MQIFLRTAFYNVSSRSFSPVNKARFITKFLTSFSNLVTVDLKDMFPCFIPTYQIKKLVEVVLFRHLRFEVPLALAWSS